MFQLLYLNTYSKDLVWPVAVRDAYHLLQRKSVMKQKQKTKQNKTKKPVETTKGKKKKKGNCALPFHWSKLSYAIIYCNINFNQISWKKVTPLKHWKAAGVYFRCQWLILFAFSKVRVTIDWITKLKHPEKTQKWGWVHALFLPPRTQAVFFKTGQKGKCLLPVKFQQTEGRLNYWTCMHIENKH